jgi:hypothetical protein
MLRVFGFVLVLVVVLRFCSDEENSIDTPVVFRRVGDLRNDDDLGAKTEGSVRAGL